MSVLFGLTPAQERDRDIERQRDRVRRTTKTRNNSMLERADSKEKEVFFLILLSLHQRKF